MDEKSLGRKLQAARKTAGMTQQALCHQANISYSTLAKIERGAIKSPSIFTIQSLVMALGGSLDELLGMAPNAIEPPKTVSGIQFVFFDVNGCLVHFFQRAFTDLARDAGVSSDVIETIFWSYNDAVCSGRMSMDEFNAELARRTGLESVDWAGYYLDAVEPIAGMDEVVKLTAETCRVGLLTNIMPELLPALQARGLLPAVDYDVVIDSSEVGAIKPEHKIFETAAQRAGFEPHQILLVDDDRQNVMAAEKLGWHVLWSDDFQPDYTAERIREVLNS